MAWIAVLIVASIVAALGSLVMLLSKVGMIVRWVASACTCVLGVANSMGTVKLGPHATGGDWLPATEVWIPGSTEAKGFGTARTPRKTARSMTRPQPLLRRPGRFDRSR